MLILERRETAQRSKINEEKRSHRLPRSFAHPYLEAFVGRHPLQHYQRITNEPVITSEDIQVKGQIFGENFLQLTDSLSYKREKLTQEIFKSSVLVELYTFHFQNNIECCLFKLERESTFRFHLIHTDSVCH